MIKVATFTGAEVNDDVSNVTALYDETAALAELLEDGTAELCELELLEDETGAFWTLLLVATVLAVVELAAVEAVEAVELVELAELVLGTEVLLDSLTLVDPTDPVVEVTAF